MNSIIQFYIQIYIYIYLFIPPLGLTALVDLGPLIVEVSRSHSDTSHSVRLLWMSDQPVTETSSWQHTTLTRERERDHVPSDI